MPTNVGVRRVFTAASLAAVALLAQGAGAVAAIPPSADMAITMTGPATATAGTDITYLFTITNNGPDTAEGVLFNPVPPADTTYVSLTLTSSTQPTTTVPAATIYTFMWVLHVNPATPAGTVITNTLTISATTLDPIPANNTTTVLTTVGAGALPGDGDGSGGDDNSQSGNVDHGDGSGGGDDNSQSGNVDHGDGSGGGDDNSQSGNGDHGDRGGGGERAD